MFGPEQVLEIGYAFGLGEGARLTGRIERGEQGRICELVAAGGRFAVKSSFAADVEVDGEDAEFQTAARAAGVPAPAVVRTAAGEVFAEIGGGHVRVFEWVDLLPPDRRVDPAEVGSVVAASHLVPFAGARPQDPWYTEPVGAAEWDALIADLETARAPFARDVAGLRDELVAVEAVLEPARSLQTCHRDLWADNLRPLAGGGVCLIDWDNCGLADPGQELSVPLFEFAAGDAGRARDLCGEYLRRGGPGRINSRGDFSMAIAQLGHILELHCRGWLDPAASDGERARDEAAVREFTDGPLTLEVVDELLDAVGGLGRRGG